jgi:hypothetical protein
MSVSNQMAVQRAALHENSMDHQDMQGTSTDVVRESLQLPANTAAAEIGQSAVFDWFKAWYVCDSLQATAGASYILACV